MSEVIRRIPKVVVREYDLGASTASPTLTDGEIHVWRQSLEPWSHPVERYRSVLSPDELQRAGRFRFDRDRNEFLVSRATLRTLLGCYLDIPANQLRFFYSEYGRPLLPASDYAEEVDFNVSHSDGMLLLAFTRGRKIGIDIEKVRRDFVTAEIAERFFSAAERLALRELPHEQRHEAFFRCWTRKEAFIKALGEGLRHPLDQFDVSLAAGQPPTLLATRPDAGEARRWLLWNVPVPSDYVAALAAEA
jgi:4'-phosphopantetheinyl transferase